MNDDYTAELKADMANPEKALCVQCPTCDWRMLYRCWPARGETDANLAAFLDGLADLTTRTRIPAYGIWLLDADDEPPTQDQLDDGNQRCQLYRAADRTLIADGTFKDAIGAALDHNCGTGRTRQTSRTAPGEIPPAYRAQMNTAAETAEQAAVARTLGGRIRQWHPDGTPKAITRVVEAFECAQERWAEGDHGYVCPHKDPYLAQPTHWFLTEPGARLCDSCAEPVIAAARMSKRCDLCGRDNGDPTICQMVIGHITVHSVLCDDCYPEGADTPYV
jgi:hypothetical protein